MPSTQGLEMLVRKRSLSKNDWFALVEARRSLIKPHLNTFTLPELGSLECLERESFKHDLYVDAPKVIGDKRFSLKMQGIFYSQPWSAIERDVKSGYRPGPGGVSVPNGIMQIWGLARSGSWILAEVKFVGSAGYKGRGYERAVSVSVTEMDLPTIISKAKVEPEEVWRGLGKAIEEWFDFRENLRNQAFNILRMVQIEELALSLVHQAD